MSYVKVLGCSHTVSVSGCTVYVMQDSSTGSSRGTGPSTSQNKAAAAAAAAAKTYSTAYWGTN